MKKNSEIPRVDHVKTNIITKDQFHILYHPANFPVTNKPHRHNHYQIMWFPDAKGNHCIDNICFNMSGNDLFLVSEGQTHYYENVENIQGYILLFKDVYWEEALASVQSFKTSLFNHLLINVHLQLSSEDASDITHVMEDILKESNRPDFQGKEDIMASYLKILLIRISNFQRTVALPSPHANKNDYLLFQQFLDLLEKEYTVYRDVLYYADKLHITTRKLASICREYNSRNPKSLIEDRALISAKRQLQFDPTSIKEIAAALNFSDQFQFSKFFKKLTGISPVEYRVQFTKTDM